MDQRCGRFDFGRCPAGNSGEPGLAPIGLGRLTMLQSIAAEQQNSNRKPRWDERRVTRFNMKVRMTRKQRKSLNQRRRSQPGTPPGTISIDPNAQPTHIRVMAYSSTAIHETALMSVDQIKPLLQHWPVVWIDVTGLGNAQTIQELGNLFSLHALALEDVVNVHQRAKLEEYPDHLFIVARMCNPEDEVHTEQISLFLRQNVLITFQERPGDCWNPVRERLRHSRGRIVVPMSITCLCTDGFNR